MLETFLNNKDMRILVTGKNGQLGQSIQKLVNNSRHCITKHNFKDFIFVGREELDLSSLKNIAKCFNVNENFDIIINCAAYTSVDKAEEEIELADQINHQAVKQLAKVADSKKSKLIHISTDYVFDGKRSYPYIEDDETNPINVYGKTKLAGEKALNEIMKTNAIIIRTSWLYSEYGNNFVKSMLKLGKENQEIDVVCDQIGSPTNAADLAETILTIINNYVHNNQEQSNKIYHYSNEGELSWYEFAKEIFQQAKIECQINPISLNEFVTKAKRPLYTVMKKSKIKNVQFYNWQKSLLKLKGLI